MKLVIIGNAFDLACGYNTSYTNYREYLNLHNKEYSIGSFTISSIFSLASNEMWANFEEALGEYDFGSFGSFYSEINYDLEGARFEEQRSRNEDLLEDYKKIKENLHPLICRSLSNFVFEKTKDFEKTEINKRLKRYINNNNVFITFNYTKSLENIYEIKEKNVLHIHGMADYSTMDPDSTSIPEASIIFGHGNGKLVTSDIDEYYDNIFEPEKVLQDLSNRLAKDYQLDEIQRIFSIKEAEEVRTLVIIGHGLGSIDSPYFEEINRLGKKIDKVIYYNFNKNEEKEKKEILKKIFPKARIYMEHY